MKFDDAFEAWFATYNTGRDSLKGALFTAWQAALASRTPSPAPEGAAEWTITAPDGRTWKGESPVRACAAAQRDTIDPVLALERINAMVEEETAIHDKEMKEAWEEGCSVWFMKILQAR